MTDHVDRYLESLELDAEVERLSSIVSIASMRIAHLEAVCRHHGIDPADPIPGWHSTTPTQLTVDGVTR